MYTHHDLCVCTALRKASRAVTRVYDDALAKHGLTTPQFAILRCVARDPGVALARLAGTLMMDRTSLYRALAPLERQGWIEVGAGGGRARQAMLTDAGRTLFDAAERNWAAVQARVTAAFGAAEWTALEARLAALTAAAVQP